MLRLGHHFVLNGYLALMLAAPVGAADEELTRISLTGEVARTARRLAAADELAEQGKWADAVEEYHRILTEAGDDLVPLDPRHSLQARWVCHLRLAAAPPAALQLYRSRVDGQAKRWLEQGSAQRSAALLRRIVEESFCSQATDQALDLLGDLAFEKGSFDEAERWWRMLAGPAAAWDRDGQQAPPKTRDADRAFLRYPDPKVDLARVRAKIILVGLFRGERTAWQPELETFQKLHATARGALAGQEGLYSEILQALARQPGALQAPVRETTWSTFAGDPSRNFVVPKPPGNWARLRSLEAPLWKWAFPESAMPASPDKVLSLSQAARALVYYPVIDGERVFFADGHRVFGYSLLDNRQILQYDLANYGVKSDGAVEPGQSYTLSVAGNRIFARLGARRFGPPRRDLLRSSQPTYLVCLDLQLEGRGLERWRISSEGMAPAGPVFEGAPVAGLGRVFVAESRFADGQVQTALVCLNADTGKREWRQEVCRASQDVKEDAGQRSRPHLVTLAGSTLYYCSHTGAVVALDAATGRHRWAMRYPSQAPLTLFGEPVLHDLAPCLYAGGRLYVAPLDSDRIFCLDPETGQTIWENGPLHVLQLLGVAKGRLIFTTTTPQACIRAVEAATGRDLRSWMQPADGSELRSFGRGVLAGDYVFWPIQSDLRQGTYVLDQETGTPVMFDEGIAGNLAVGCDCLAIAGLRELAVYVPAARLLQRRRVEAARPGAAPSARYQLALAEADAGLFHEALAHLDELDATIMPAVVPRQRHQILLDAARQAEQQGNLEQAAEFLTQAAQPRFSVAQRLTALSQQAALWSKAKRGERTVAVWQAVLEDADLRSGLIDTRDGPPQVAAAHARAQIDALIRTGGRTIYAAVEHRARAMLAQTAPLQPMSVAARKAVLEQLGREFPHAATTASVLNELARLQEQAGEFGAAAATYRQILGDSQTTPERARLLAGLARAYEQENCWSAARSTWQELVTEQGDQAVPFLSPTQPVRRFVAGRLQQAGYRRLNGSRWPELELPLTRTWQFRGESDTAAPAECFLLPSAAPPAANAFLYSVATATLTCWDGSSGKARWRTSLPEEPRWLGSVADIIIAVGSDSIDGLTVAEGKPVWSLRLDRAAPSPRLSGVQLVGSRLFFVQDGRRLLALDVFGGRVLWSFGTPAWQGPSPFRRERVSVAYLATEASVLLQTTTGRALLLDSQTGRLLHDYAAAEEPWARAPFSLCGQRICVQNDAQHLTTLDARTGAVLWKYAVDRPVSLSGEPLQVLAGEQALLILVSRNYGYYLECLDPQTGNRRWSRSCFVGTQPFDLEGGSVDDVALYGVQNGSLCALALGDGRRLWKRLLPAAATQWRTARTEQALLAFPQARPGVAWQLRGLGVGEVRLTFPHLPTEENLLPVFLVEPSTGQLLERLNLPGRLPQPTATWQPTWISSLVPRWQRHEVALAETGVTVQLCAHGLLVTAAERGWVLGGAKSAASTTALRTFKAP